MKGFFPLFISLIYSKNPKHNYLDIFNLTVCSKVPSAPLYTTFKKLNVDILNT